MGKKGWILCLMLLLPAWASAAVYEGATVSIREQAVVAEAGGLLESLSLMVGQAVTAGEQAGQTAARRAFATQDGTVGSVLAAAGEAVQGTVLTLAPAYRYVVYCTTDQAYNSAETQLIHSGEQVYLRCTKNGTHTAVGQVTTLSAKEYKVEVFGGELYVGETVYVYRAESFADSTRIGVGTVVSSPVEAYETEGTVLDMRVAPGDWVQRGQLLYTWAEAADTAIISPAAGVVTSVAARQGETLEAGAQVAGVTAYEDILLQMTVEAETATALTVGQSVTYTAGCDPTEAPRTGYVSEIFAMEEENAYVVRMIPTAPETRVGMRVEISFD